MDPPPSSDTRRLDSLLERFLVSNPDAGPAEFEAWAAQQPELARQPDLVQRLARHLGNWERIEAELKRVLPGGEARFFRPGGVRQLEQGDEESALPVGADLGPDSRVAHFVLRRRIGAGGMGEVWEAWDEELRRPVALKFVLPERLDLGALQRFEREARAGGRLTHPNVVHTLDFSKDSTPAWIAQELVEGSWTLKDFIDELRAADAVPKDYYRHAAVLAAQLADGLQAAHENGVIHRDLKPQNILIAPDDTPKIADFGLARVVDDSFLSMTGDFAGTWAYMSPEQVTAKRMGLDHRTDIFSLGVVLYELLSLRRPFEGDTTPQIAAKIITFDPPEPSKIRSQCPRELSIIVGKALEKDPDRRYQTMADFAADLRRHLANEPIHAKPPGPFTRAVKWSKRNPAISSAGAVALLALAVISGLLVQQVQTANELARSNIDLASQTQRAEAGEREAQRNAEEAARNATTASIARDEATQKANDVLSLSAQKDHDDLVAEAATLWPALPETIPAYEDWLRSAHELIDGRPENEEQGLKQRPSLAEHRAKLAELRRDAQPLSAAELHAERESHPKFAELQAKLAELSWRSRMLGEEPWPSEASVEAALAKEGLPTDANALNSLAWPLVDPAKPVYGQEVRALLLARRAVAAANAEQRSGIRDSLAWALFRVGRFDEALSEERTALSEPGGDALKESAAGLEQAVEGWRADELAKRRETQDELSAEVAALSALVNERRTYEFEDPEKEWWDRQLVKLVSDLEALHDPQTGLAGETLSEPFGWGVAKRYEFAQSIGQRSVDGQDAKRLWSEAMAAIQSSPHYGGLAIAPQIGLLPLGMDPDSGLWEFAHLQTGEPAVRGVDGKLILTEETGLVFVLIPGGTFWMGAQNEPGAQNHDPQAQSNDNPVHEVELSPYFLSKFEMTQAQWKRVADVNPSSYQPPSNLAGTLLHPVEQVSWTQCMEMMEWLGLALPSEAQWERGARGGTDTAWWTGQERESLRGKVNLADQAAYNAGARWAEINDWTDLDDDWAVHAPVDTFSANRFGLHEVVGNVWEWCLDGYTESAYPEERGRDPVVPWDGSSSRVYRGGSFDFAASLARSASRYSSAPELRAYSLGLRPARALRLSPSPLHPPK